MLPVANVDAGALVSDRHSVLWSIWYVQRSEER